MYGAVRLECLLHPLTALFPTNCYLYPGKYLLLLGCFVVGTDLEEEGRAE